MDPFITPLIGAGATLFSTIFGHNEDSAAKKAAKQAAKQQQQALVAQAQQEQIAIMQAQRQSEQNEKLLIYGLAGAAALILIGGIVYSRVKK